MLLVVNMEAQWGGGVNGVVSASGDVAVAVGTAGGVFDKEVAPEEEEDAAIDMVRPEDVSYDGRKPGRRRAPREHVRVSINMVDSL